MPMSPLRPEDLYRRCDPVQFAFDTTADLQPSEDFLGQERAIGALRFGMGMRHKGYNLFALGPAGTGKFALVHRQLAARAPSEQVPPDWCYVFNFSDAHQPLALRLPPGKGGALKRDMEQLVEDVNGAIGGVFESDEYRTRLQSVQEEFEERQEQALAGIQKKAERKDIVLLRTPAGFTLAPLRDGKPLGPDEFHALGEEERERIEADINELQKDMRKAMHQMPLWKKRTDEKIQALNREMAAAAIVHLLSLIHI